MAKRVIKLKDIPANFDSRGALLSSGWLRLSVMDAVGRPVAVVSNDPAEPLVWLGDGYTVKVDPVRKGGENENGQTHF